MLKNVVCFTETSRLPTSSHHLMRCNKIFHHLQKVPLSCRSRDVHRDYQTYSGDCKSMFSCRKVGNKEFLESLLIY